MRKLLLVLVDGLPHWKLTAEDTPFLWGMNNRALQPGIGFSINIYPELLAGETPDRLGFFNKWRVKRPEEMQPVGGAEKIMRSVGDLTRVSFPVSRIAHKALEYTGLTGATGNVPFRLLPYMELNPKNQIFDTDAYPTIFHLGRWYKTSASDVKLRFGRRDPVAVDRAREGIEQGENVFVLMADLDATAHARGMGRAFDEQLRRADVWCRELNDHFLQYHGDNGLVVIVSDHGMQIVEADGIVKLPLERRFGRASPASFLYMLDAIMLRVWIYDEALRQPILDYLAGCDAGHVLSYSDRQELGITNPEFGEIVFMLDEGKVFYPSFFGGRVPKAVHGYDPRRYPSQYGIVACSDSSAELPWHAKDLFPFLQRAMGGIRHRHCPGEDERKSEGGEKEHE